jgi:hypothetical protein
VKATEIFVEQLLIGLMVLFSTYMLAHGDLSSRWIAQQMDAFSTKDSIFVNVIFGFLIVGTAYLIGIVYDRWADTILQDIDQHSRLHYALKGLGKNNFDELICLEKDPYPEQDIRLQIMIQGKTLADYHNYLRSRIRLTRAMTTFIPIISLSLLMNSLHLCHKQRLPITISVAVIYAFVLTFKIFRLRRLKKMFGFIEPPKSNNFDKLKEYVEINRKKNDEPKDKDKIELEWKIDNFTREPVFWGLAAITVMGFYIIFSNNSHKLFIFYPVLGFILTLLVGWTWLRINNTLISLLKRYQRLYPKECLPKKD